MIASPDAMLGKELKRAQAYREACARELTIEALYLRPFFISSN
jgi:hypothetical protein